MLLEHKTSLMFVNHNLIYQTDKLQVIKIYKGEYEPQEPVYLKYK